MGTVVSLQGEQQYMVLGLEPSRRIGQWVTEFPILALRVPPFVISRSAAGTRRKSSNCPFYD